MNKFVYTPRAGMITLPSEYVINKTPRTDAPITPVVLNFHFTVDGVLIAMDELKIQAMNYRTCDLVGDSLSFSPILGAGVMMAHFPYQLDNVINFDLIVELTKLPVSSVDLVKFYHSYFASRTIAWLSTPDNGLMS